MNFEKLNVWKLSARLSAQIYKTTSSLKDYSYRDQLTRSGLSVPSNLAEGMTRESGREQKRFIDIARASLSEVRTQIYIGIDIGYVNKEVGAKWLVETRELHAMLNSLKNKIKVI